MQAGKVEKAHRSKEVKKSKCNNTRDSSWKNDNGNFISFKENGLCTAAKCRLAHDGTHFFVSESVWFSGWELHL